MKKLKDLKIGDKIYIFHYNELFEDFGIDEFVIDKIIKEGNTIVMINKDGEFCIDLEKLETDYVGVDQIDTDWFVSSNKSELKEFLKAFYELVIGIL